MIKLTNIYPIYEPIDTSTTVQLPAKMIKSADEALSEFLVGISDRDVINISPDYDYLHRYYVVVHKV